MINKFEMWSLFHYLMIIFPFVLAIGLYYLFRNKSKHTQQLVSVILSTVMVTVFIMRAIHVTNKYGGINPEVFPFQICHFANFIFLFAALSKRKIWGSIGWVLNFPAGLVSVIFADGLVNYPTLIEVQAFAYVVGHMLIVTTGLYMLLIRQIEINHQTLKQTIGFVGVMFVSSVIINNVFNVWFKEVGVASNYFYSLTPEKGTPLEWMFNFGKNVTVLNMTFNPIYLILLAIVGLVVMLFMYGLYQLRSILYTNINNNENN